MMEGRRLPPAGTHRHRSSVRHHCFDVCDSDRSQEGWGKAHRARRPPPALPALPPRAGSNRRRDCPLGLPIGLSHEMLQGESVRRSQLHRFQECREVRRFGGWQKTYLRQLTQKYRRSSAFIRKLRFRGVEVAEFDIHTQSRIRGSLSCIKGRLPQSETPRSLHFFRFSFAPLPPARSNRSTGASWS